MVKKKGLPLFNTNGVWCNPDSQEIYDAGQIKSIAAQQLGEGREKEFHELQKQRGFIFFSSKLEAKCYLELLTLFEPKEIQLQVKVDIIKPKKFLHSGISWKPDFLVADLPRAKKIFIESKGFETEVYKIKRILLLEFCERVELIVCKKPSDVHAIKLLHSKFTQNEVSSADIEQLKLKGIL